MPYVIAEPCNDVKDKACVEACPVDCIYEVGSQLMINPEECIDCGACVDPCPVQAIHHEDELPDKWKKLITKYYTDPDIWDVETQLASEYGLETPLSNDDKIMIMKNEKWVYD